MLPVVFPVFMIVDTFILKILPLKEPDAVTKQVKYLVFERDHLGLERLLLEDLPTLRNKSD